MNNVLSSMQTLKSSDDCDKFSKSVSYETLVGGTATTGTNIKQTQKMFLGNAVKPLSAVGTLTSLLCNSAKVVENLLQTLPIVRLIKLLGLVVVLSVGIISESWAENPSGTCGTNCNWTIENGTLKITGGQNGEIGTMDDYEQHNVGVGVWQSDTSPWKNYVSSITSVDVKNVENIGQGAFIGINGITNLDDNVKKIGYLSNTRITGNNIPQHLETLDAWALNTSHFNDIPYLELPDSLKTIGVGALYQINIPVIIPDSVETIANNGVYSAFGTGENLQIICRGTKENCKRIASLFSKYCPLGGSGCRKESDFVDLSSKVALADSSNCDSANYYWSGIECARRNIDGSINCASGYAEYKNKCWSELPFAKKRWTPAEANEWLHDGNDNFVVITFKK